MPADRFATRAGTEFPAVTADQMREIDRIAIEETGPNLYQMMENAGRSLAMATIERLGTHARSVFVLAGIGGNGGGGICAARHLANHGVEVTLVLADDARLDVVPAQQLAIYQSTPGQIRSPDQLSGLGAHIVIDALIGYSLTGTPRGVTADLIGFANARGEQVIALDVPSGIDATTGEAPGDHVTADLTVTLALPKTGLDGPAVGRLELADIGIPRAVYEQAGVSVPTTAFGLGYRTRIKPL
ncbi:MAG: NAD(P)H-hydrate epimerase [Acidimicrobiia bacterium]